MKSVTLSIAPTLLLLAVKAASCPSRHPFAGLLDKSRQL